MGNFYWLKLKKDFFKRHDIVNLRSSENGFLNESIFIHLMAESIDHEAKLRYSEKKPYTPKTLGNVVGVDEQTMKKALEIFEELELVEILEDGTIFIPLAAENIGCESAWAEKKRQYRERQRTEEGQSEDKSRTSQGQKEDLSDKSKSIEKEKEKDIELDKYKEKEKEREKGEPSSPTLPEKKTRFVPPTLEEVKAYCDERQNGIDPQHFIDFYSAKNWFIGKNKMKDWQAAVRTWESRRKEEPRMTRQRPEEIPYEENDYDFSKYTNELALKELDEFIEKSKIEKNKERIIGIDGKEKTSLWNSL